MFYVSYLLKVNAQKDLHGEVEEATHHRQVRKTFRRMVEREDKFFDML